MKYRSRAFESVKARREEAAAIYQAYLSVESPDQVKWSRGGWVVCLSTLEC